MAIDFNTVANTFQSVSADGAKLKNDLAKLDVGTPTTPDQQQAIKDLLGLAQLGVQQLTQAAQDSRAKRIQELTPQIDAITEALASNLDPGTADHLRSIQNNLLAERAQLELVDASDFSHVVSPDFVQKLITQLKAAQEEVTAKQRAAAAIPILMGAVQLTIKIVGFILAAVG